MNNESNNLSNFLYNKRTKIFHQSQENAAKTIGISRTYYNKLECGNIKNSRTSYNVITKIARWAGVAPDYVDNLNKGRKRE